MQVLPFVPTHNNCEAACCIEAVTCCKAEVNMNCAMAMTSCNISLFVPLISAPLIKVESIVQLDVALVSLVSNETINCEQHPESDVLSNISESPPPQYLPLLI